VRSLGLVYGGTNLSQAIAKRVDNDHCPPINPAEQPELKQSLRAVIEYSERLEVDSNFFKSTTAEGGNLSRLERVSQDDSFEMIRAEMAEHPETLAEENMAADADNDERVSRALRRHRDLMGVPLPDDFDIEAVCRDWNQNRGNRLEGWSSSRWHAG
jgi:hypothetical protein